MDFPKLRRLFEVPGLQFLVSDILSETYKQFDYYFIFNDGAWKSYINEEDVSHCLSEGVKFIKDQIRFDSYVKNYNKYITESARKLDKILNKTNLEKSDAVECLELFICNHSFYIFTEFYYLDKAALLKEKSAKNNLETIGTLKNTAREHLNRIFFGSNCFLFKFLNKISTQFSIQVPALESYSCHEITSLFDNGFVLNSIIEQRKTAFIMCRQLRAEGEEAMPLIESLLKSFEQSKELITGTPVSPGKTIGKVIVLLSGYEGHYDRLNEVMDGMKNGQILVAETTSPELLPACKKAGAIVTNQGGLLSHAAIVSRELKIPCIVGVGNATDVLHDGDEVEVDADKGIVKILNRA